MVDQRVIARKLEQIEQYHGELLTEQQSLSREDLRSNTTDQRAVERMFELAIQACSDLALHIATTRFDYDGDAAKEAIRLLGQAGLSTRRRRTPSSLPLASGTSSPTSMAGWTTIKCTNSSRPGWMSTTPSVSRSLSGLAN